MGNEKKKKKISNDRESEFPGYPVRATIQGRRDEWKIQGFPE